MDIQKLIDVLSQAVTDCEKKAKEAADASLRLTGQRDAYKDILNYIQTSEEKENSDDAVVDAEPEESEAK